MLDFSPSSEAPFTVYHGPCDHLYEHKRFIGWEAMYLPCPDCKPEATAPLHEDAKERASRAAAARNHKRGLAPLAGTDKQVRWAEVLRDAQLLLVESLVAAWEAEYRRCGTAGFVPTSVHENWLAATIGAKALRVRIEARFWIAKKDTSAAKLLGVSWPKGLAG